MPRTPAWIRTFNKDFEQTFRTKQFVRFQDGEGYSLIDEYQPWYRKQMGLDDSIPLKPLFKFIFYADQTIDDGKYVPLMVSVAQTTEVNENGNVRYMLNDSRVKRLKPVDVESRDEFYINTESGKVFEKRKNKYHEVNVEKIYQRLLKIHVSDWRTPKGASTRFRIFFTRRLLSLFCKSIAWVLGYVIFFIKGKRYEYDVIRERYLSSPRDSENRVTSSTPPPNDIDFFGYKVSVWTLFTYSLVVIILYAIFVSAINNLLSNSEAFSSLLTITSAILSIVTYDKILPRLFRLGVKYGETFSYDLRYTGIKIKV